MLAFGLVGTWGRSGGHMPCSCSRRTMLLSSLPQPQNECCAMGNTQSSVQLGHAPSEVTVDAGAPRSPLCVRISQ